MATIKKAQKGASMVKTPVKKVNKNLEGPQDAFKYSKGMPIVPKTTYEGGSKAKSGTSMKKKMKDGGSLGMKSVKAGVDKNSGVTRADIIVAGTKKAKTGTKIKKAGTHKMPDGSMMKNSAMKSGGKMSKCKYGCN